MSRRPPRTDGSEHAGPEPAGPPAADWPLRPCSFRSLLRGQTEPRAEPTATLLRWDPGWAWARLARAEKARPDPLELIARSSWWAITSENAVRALDLLWRHGVATALMARRLRGRDRSLDPEMLEHAGMIHALGYWLMALSNADVFSKVIFEPNPGRRLRIERTRLGEEAAVLAQKWAERTDRHPLVIDACFLMDEPMERSRSVADPVDAVSILRRARWWAERTRWSIERPGGVGDDSDPRVRWLEGQVESICRAPFIDLDETPNEEAWARRCAVLMGERAEWQRERERWERRAKALRSSSVRDRVRFEEELYRRKLDALAEFAAGAGHELNNPLAVIQGRAQLLAAKTADQESDQARGLRAIIEQAQRAHRMIRDLMAVARPSELLAQDCSPRELLESCLRDLGPSAKDRRIQLRLESPEPERRIHADPNALRQLADAFVRNAIEASREGGLVVVESKVDRNGLRWTFRDDGPGIDVIEGRRLFDPFFCGRQAGRGLGLGLPRAAALVRRMRGKIRWRSKRGRGTLFQVLLPLVEATKKR